MTITLLPQVWSSTFQLPSASSLSVPMTITLCPQNWSSKFQLPSPSSLSNPMTITICPQFWRNNFQLPSPCCKLFFCSYHFASENAMTCTACNPPMMLIDANCVWWHLPLLAVVVGVCLQPVRNGVRCPCGLGFGHDARYKSTPVTGAAPALLLGPR
jgi:hypothetical protein